jgi:hypothetical protein
MRTPLGFEHANLPGRYHLALLEPRARGEVRPLHDPTTVEE